jgi:hypothetical protein
MQNSTRVKYVLLFFTRGKFTHTNAASRCFNVDDLLKAKNCHYVEVYTFTIIFIIRVKVALPDISPEIHFVFFAFYSKK